MKDVIIGLQHTERSLSFSINFHGLKIGILWAPCMRGLEIVLYATWEGLSQRTPLSFIMGIGDGQGKGIGFTRSIMSQTPPDFKLDLEEEDSVSNTSGMVW